MLSVLPMILFIVCGFTSLLILTYADIDTFGGFFVLMASLVVHISAFVWRFAADTLSTACHIVVYRRRLPRLVKSVVIRLMLINDCRRLRSNGLLCVAYV